LLASILRAAGAVAGVVLEKHLRQVCDDHKITVAKKNPTIGDLNELLKKGASSTCRLGETSRSSATSGTFVTT
jgi:hypothetical protein